MLANLKSPFKRTSSLVFTFLLSGSYVGGSIAMEIDTDSDGMPDAWENIYLLDPLVVDDRADNDGDGWTNFQEYARDTDPTDPNSKSEIVVNDSAFTISGDRQSNFYKIDLESGQAVKIGNLGVSADFEALAFSPDGELYALEDSSYKLYKVNQDTGEALLVGNTNTSGSNPGITFDDEGRLWFVGGNGVSNLYELNPETASSRYVGRVGSWNGWSIAHHKGLLYMVDSNARNLYSIDSSTAEATLVGATGISIGAQHGMSSDGDKIWLLSESGARLYTINMITGEATVEQNIIGHSGNLESLAIANIKDSDGDGMPDYFEQKYGLDSIEPNDALDDFDQDGLSNLQEYLNGTKVDVSDSDDDGLSDGEEFYLYRSHPLLFDSDEDGLSDGDEVHDYGTSPVLADSDNDGMPDGWEVEHLLIPTLDDAEEDADGDGLKNREEFSANTLPNIADTDEDAVSDGEEVHTHSSSPLLSDSDGDGLSDGDEINIYGTSPIELDSDNDGMQDGWEIEFSLDPLANDSTSDTDSDGLSNLQEYKMGTNPISQDTDSDGLKDGDEVNLYHSNPLKADTDYDDLTDGEEVNSHQTSPIFEDTDEDGLPDGWEVNFGLDPLKKSERLDSDGDGWFNYFEYDFDTDPTASDSVPRLNAPDSDLDGMEDSWEIDNGFDPFDVSDAKQDSDGDGLLNMQEYHISAEFKVQVDPYNADTDDDGLNDFKEFVKYRTDPKNADTDDDEMPDGWEVSNSLDPLVNDADVDSDEDGVSNLEEFNAGTIPNNPYLENLINGTAQENLDEVVTTHTQANGGGGLSILLLALFGFVLPKSRRSI